MQISTNLLESTSKEAEDTKCIIVVEKGSDDSNDNHSHLAEEEDRLATKIVGQHCEEHGANHDSSYHDGLSSVFHEPLVAHQIPL